MKGNDNLKEICIADRKNNLGKEKRHDMTVTTQFSGPKVGLQEEQKIEMEYQTRVNSE